jgi:energy-coupling factor transporter transmembrane protein EcfT
MKASLTVRHMVGRRPHLGTAGFLACLLFSLAAPVLAQGSRFLLACTIAFILAAVFYPEGLKVFASRRLWLFLGILVTTMTWLVGPGDGTLGGVAVPHRGLAVGLEMALRALTIVVAVTGFAASVSVSELAGLMERSGLKGLGFASGVAFNMLPIVRTTAMNTYQAIRLRGGFRRQRFRTLGLLLITVITNSLRHADDIVTAAEARAFSTSRARPLSITRSQGDYALAAGLIAVAFLLVV